MNSLTNSDNSINSKQIDQDTHNSSSNEEDKILVTNPEPSKSKQGLTGAQKRKMFMKR